MCRSLHPRIGTSIGFAGNNLRLRLASAMSPQEVLAEECAGHSSQNSVLVSVPLVRDAIRTYFSRLSRLSLPDRCGHARLMPNNAFAHRRASSCVLRLSATLNA